MTEKDLNRLINQNFKRVGFGHKLQDPQYASTKDDKKIRFNLKRPFDGFAVTPGMILYYETKMIKGYKALSLSLIKDHQIKALEEIDNHTFDNLTVFPIIILGVYLQRIGFDLFFFSICGIQELMESDKKSISKADLLKFKERGWWIPLRKKTFDVGLIPKKTIDWNDEI